MWGRKIGALLMGALFVFCSCVDDTYDLSKKELSLDMKIEGNRIALPLGSLRPIVLDSILDISSVPMLEVDAASRRYSLSFSDSVVTRVAQKDLDVLKEVSKLSSDIDPVRISLDEIRFKFPSFEYNDSMSFQNVELSDVSLNAVHEEIDLSIKDFSLDPISISEENHNMVFDIPIVELDKVEIGEYSQMASFTIDDILIEDVSMDAVNERVNFDVERIPVDDIATPTFMSQQSTILQNEEVEAYLAGKDDSFVLPTVFSTVFDIRKSSDCKVDIQFHYMLPEEIEHLNSVKMVCSDDTKKGALVEFELKNPTLLDGLSRFVDFNIQFPKNYKLALGPDQEQFYTLSNENEVSVKNMPANGETTLIRFYLSEIAGLNDDRYYEWEGDDRILRFDDEVSCNVDYIVAGDVSLPAGTSIAAIKEGLTYSVSLDASYDVEEAYGDTNPIRNQFDNKELDFSFSIEDLEYINYIDKVVLNPSVSQLRFVATADEGFGDFDIDYPNSKIILSFPKEYVFSDDLVLPEGVKQVSPTDFEISSVSVFNGAEWVLPIREVKVESDVKDGVLEFNKNAVIKAVSGTTEGFLTIDDVHDVALKKAAESLSGEHHISLSVSPVLLSVIDVQGRTNPIDVTFENEIFNVDFDITGLEYVKTVDYVEFDAEQKISISSSADKGFGNMKFEEGSCIALRFPAEIEFDMQHSTLPYDTKLKAFVINDLSQLKAGHWSLALKRVNINKDVVDNTLNISTSVTLEAVNAKGEPDKLYVVGDELFSLDEMRKQNLFGLQEIKFVVEGPEENITIAEMKGKSNNVDVEFEGEELKYTFAIDSLDYINHVGYIELKEGSNYLLFHSNLSGDLGRFNLAANSYVDFIFPEGFELDPVASSIPAGMAKFVENNTRIRVSDLNALDYVDNWKLAVKRIHIDQPIVDRTFSRDYTIRIVGYNANGVERELTIAALDPLYLTEVQGAGGERTMEISVLKNDIEIEDIEASVDDIDFAFDKQTFTFPVKVDKLDLVKEISFISFEEGYNVINLHISLNSGMDPFELAEHSVVKISFPKNFVLDLEACDFGDLIYEKEENAIFVNNIKDIENCHIKLALDRIDINQVIENNQFDWTGEITVTAVNTLTEEEGTLYIAGVDNLLLSDVSSAMGDKMVTFDVPATHLRIKEAVMISNMVSADIKESIEIPLDETIHEAIDRVDSIGFVNPVPMTLTVKTVGLETVDAPVNLNMDITFPPVFAISSNDEKVTITDQGLHIEASHSFKESRDIQFGLLVNSLDFTTLEEGYLTLSPTEDGGRRLQYDSEANIVGSVSIDNAQLSSSLLNTGVSLDITFDMGEIVLKDFTGLYGGSIDKVTDSFELGVEDGFSELEKNGLTLSNTKPELMVSLYNTIGMPIDVDLSLVGRDKEGVAIATSTIVLDDLRIKPAQLDGQGALVADTTRWIFTSNENAMVPGYEVIVVKNLDSLLNELPYTIDFVLDPQIVTKDVTHRVDLSKPLELGGHYSISVPFDLQFAQSVALDLGEEVDFLRKKENKITLANPQLMLGIHNPIAQDLVFDLSVVGKDAKGQPINSASLVFDEPFVLSAGHRNADGTITPKATRWLFAVSDSITKQGYETKEAPALATLLNELPYNIDIALNAHFNTDLTAQIDYENDLELACEYAVLVPLQFEDIHLNYTDTISEIKLNLEETIEEMNLSITDIELAVNMNLKNTLPLGLTLTLVPLDAQGNVIEEIEIGSIDLPAGDGSDIGAGDTIEGKPVELSVKCFSSSDLSALDKIAFSIDVASGNGDNALGGAQGLQVSDIVLQIMCDIEMDLGK